jgi:hypothetical protein
VAGDGARDGCRFGAIGDSAHPEPFRANILLADDDPAGSPAEAAIGRARRGWRRGGFDVRVAYPWPARRFDKSDFADMMASAGAEAVRDRIFQGGSGNEQEDASAGAAAAELRHRPVVRRAGSGNRGLGEGLWTAASSSCAASLTTRRGRFADRGRQPLVSFEQDLFLLRRHQGDAGLGGKDVPLHRLWF